ncbi:alkaline phosphatase family protein [Candidatus Bathyarchaeota archaeon]|nr:alkaline phosphatase family protein [Candidatus Bathyarchaeota archaeon]
MSTIDLTGEAIKGIGASGQSEHEILKPDYKGLNLSSMGSTILKILGIESDGSKPLHEMEPFKGHLEDLFKPQPERLILILVDSLNLELLSSLVTGLERARKPYYGLLKGLVTSTFPSVTPTALMTLYTGLPPLAHGVLGFEFYLKEADRIINPFKLDSNETFLKDVFGSAGNLFEEAAQKGLGVCTFMPQHLSSSPATHMMLKNVKVIGYRSLASINRSISGAKNTELFYIYYSRLDEVLHEEGPASRKVGDVIREVQTLIQGSLKKGFGVILLSDHSFIEVNRRVGVKAGKAKIASNGGRVIYVYDGDLLESYDGQGGFESFSRDQLLKEGWLGEGEYPGRIGETILIARDGCLLTCEGKDSGDKATHGGFLMEEMVAPLAIFSPL